MKEEIMLAPNAIVVEKRNDCSHIDLIMIKMIMFWNALNDNNDTGTLQHIHVANGHGGFKTQCFAEKLFEIERWPYLNDVNLFFFHVFDLTLSVQLLNAIIYYHPTAVLRNICIYVFTSLYSEVEYFYFLFIYLYNCNNRRPK